MESKIKKKKPIITEHAVNIIHIILHKLMWVADWENPLQLGMVAVRAIMGWYTGNIQHVPVTPR